MGIRSTISKAFSQSKRTVIKAISDRIALAATPLVGDATIGFDPHRNYPTYEKLYYTDSDAALAVDIIASLAVGGGITFQGKQATVRKIEQWAKEVKFQKVTENNVKTLLVFGNAYTIPVEPEKREHIVELQVLHPAHIKIKTDITGKVEAYLYDPEKVWDSKSPYYTEYDPDDIMHFRHNVIATNVYGISLYHPCYDILQLLRRVEVTAGHLAHRDAHRLLHAKVSTRDKTELTPDPVTGEIPLETKIKSIVEVLSGRVQQLDDEAREFEISNTIGTDDTVEIKDLAASHDWNGLINITQHLQSKAQRALRVPPVFMGVPEGSNRATSTNQLKVFKKYIEGIQETVISEYKRVLSPLLPGDFDLEFEIPIAEDDSVWAEVASLLYEKGVMTLDEARAYFGLPPLNEEEPIGQ